MTEKCNCHDDINEIEQHDYYSIILRHDTSTNWAIENPILLLSEYGVEDDTHKVKRGDGKSSWNELPYETFGIDLDIEFKDIQGNVEDNEQLQEVLKNLISREVFTDSPTIVSDITFSNKEDTILNINKSFLDLNSDKLQDETFVIKSPDNSIKSIWKITGNGKAELNISAVSTISDYILNSVYNVGELCYYNHNLYICTEEVEPSETFDESKWSIVGATQAEAIDFDNSNTTLESNTVQDAIRELNDLINNASYDLDWNEY